MDTSHPQRHGIIRLAISFLIVFLLLSLLGLSDPFSFWLRPLLAQVIAMTGVQATNHADFLQVGHLMIPWTRDCAGVNLILFLWALMIWGNRGHYGEPAFWMRMLLAVPIGAAVNFLRILMLVAYRWLAYPDTESAEQHYLLGFLLILPFLPLLLGRQRRQPGWMSLLDAIYLMAVMALAATHIGSPGGYLVLFASLILLVEFQPLRYAKNVHPAVGLVWLLAGAFIGLSAMESLWIPFLLLCPFAYGSRHWRSPLTWLALPATVPVAAMHPLAGWMLAALTAGKALELALRRKQPIPVHLSRPRPMLHRAALGSAVLLPFLMPAVSWRSDTSWAPPGGTSVERVEPLSLRVRLLAQPPEMTLYAYLPSGDGRHHALETCMLYRGVRLQPSSGWVLTDGETYMKQYFLINGNLIEDYRRYVLRTFIPFSSAGVHLIAVAPAALSDPTAFERAADSLALRLVEAGHRSN